MRCLTPLDKQTAKAIIMVLKINTASSGNYKMIRYFLKLKSWELFLMLVLPLALTYLMQFKFTVSLIGL